MQIGRRMTWCLNTISSSVGLLLRQSSFFSENAKFARALRWPFSLVNVETNFVISTYVQALVCCFGAILLRRWNRHVANCKVRGARYQIGYLQTNQDTDITTRF